MKLILFLTMLILTTACNSSYNGCLFGTIEANDVTIGYPQKVAEKAIEEPIEQHKVVEEEAFGETKVTEEVE